MNCVVPMILEARGAVVATSLFTDNIALTMRQPQRAGPVSVFAPSLGRPLPSAMRWSPVRGCEKPDVAQLRTTARAAGTARAWLTIMWHCRQDRVAYNPSQHRALQRLISQDQQEAA